MGLSQSSRKLTIVNDEDDGSVIQISEAVAKRLASATAEPAPTKTTPVHHVSSANLHPSIDSSYPQLTISALEVQKQKEKELAEQEAYWQQRLQKLEKAHEKINRAIEKEYKKALTIFDDSKVIKAQNAVKPCNENSQKVLKCYQDNPKETLKCADLVQQFANCVDQRRAQLTRCN